jgi:hypothetical protein
LLNFGIDFTAGRGDSAGIFLLGKTLRDVQMLTSDTR